MNVWTPGTQVFVIPSLVVLGLCACPSPGQGPKATEAFNRARPILSALANYRHLQGRYPYALESLAPKYLSASALGAADTASRVKLLYPFEYESRGDSFKLRFRYTGPGSNECIYRSNAAKWVCSGKF